MFDTRRRSIQWLLTSADSAESMKRFGLLPIHFKIVELLFAAYDTLQGIGHWFNPFTKGAGNSLIVENADANSSPPSWTNISCMTHNVIYGETEIWLCL